MIVSGGGRPGRARFPEAAIPRRHRGCRAAFRRGRRRASRDGSAITSMRSAFRFWRRQAVSASAWAGCTRTRAISWPCSFASAPRIRPCSASGSMAISRRRTRRAMASESCTRSASASARRRARRPPISSMARARRSTTGRTSSRARARPAASPSRSPPAWASRTFCSTCCWSCASFVRSRAALVGRRGGRASPREQRPAARRGVRRGVPRRARAPYTTYCSPTAPFRLSTPSLSSWRTRAMMFCWAPSTSLILIGPSASMSSRSMSAPRCDMQPRM